MDNQNDAKGANSKFSELLSMTFKFGLGSVKIGLGFVCAVALILSLAILPTVIVIFLIVVVSILMFVWTTFFANNSWLDDKVNTLDNRLCLFSRKSRELKEKSKENFDKIVRLLLSIALTFLSSFLLITFYTVACKPLKPVSLHLVEYLKSGASEDGEIVNVGSTPTIYHDIEVRIEDKQLIVASKVDPSIKIIIAEIKSKNGAIYNMLITVLTRQAPPQRAIGQAVGTEKWDLGDKERIMASSTSDIKQRISHLENSIKYYDQLEEEYIIVPKCLLKKSQSHKELSDCYKQEKDNIESTKCLKESLCEVLNGLVLCVQYRIPFHKREGGEEYGSIVWLKYAIKVAGELSVANDLSDSEKEMYSELKTALERLQKDPTVVFKLSEFDEEVFG